MVKVLGCSDLGMRCNFVACGRTENEVLNKGAQHAGIVHNKTKLSSEETKQVRSAIREERRCPSS